MCTKVGIDFFDKLPWIDDFMKNQDFAAARAEFQGMKDIYVLGVLQIYTVKRLVSFSLHHTLAMHGYRLPHERIYRRLNKLTEKVVTDPICYLISIIYMDRVLQNMEDGEDEGLTYRKIKNIHSICLMLACKMWEDRVFLNRQYQIDFGMDVKMTHDDFNDLERKILRVLGYQLYISHSEYILFLKRNHRLFAQTIQNELASSHTVLFETVAH